MRFVTAWMALVGLAVLGVGAPTFADQARLAGLLNPGDSSIHVQQIRVTGDADADTHLYAVTVRNGGTATHRQLRRVEVWDGGEAVAVVDNTLGIDTSGGITVPMAYTVPAGLSRNLQVRVWLWGVGSIDSPKTTELALRFFYTLGTTTGMSGWVRDGRPEEIVLAGFERTQEGVLPAMGFNPNDSGTVQVTTWTDDDANSSPIRIEEIWIQNLESATASDVASVTVSIRHGGGRLPDETVTNLTGWNADGGIKLATRPFVLNDQDSLIIEVAVTVSATPTESRRIRTKVGLVLEENGESFRQSSASPATHIITRGGIEEVLDESRVPRPPVLNPGETLVQTIVLRDRDANAFDVAVTKIRLRNAIGADATGGDIAEIIVRGPGGILASTTNTGGFHTTGVEVELPRFIVPDNGEVTLTITYRAGSAVPGRTLQPEADVWAEEGRGGAAWSPRAMFPEPIYLYRAGLEIVEDMPVEQGEAYSSQEICVQRILLRDWDQNAAAVTVNPVVVRNLGTADNQDLVRLSVRAGREELGAITNLAGLRAGGVTIPLTGGNAIPDDGQLEVAVWVTVASPERDVTGRTVRLETRVLHVEGGVGYERSVLAGATVRLVRNLPPIIDFAWSPEEPLWKGTVTFMPTASDPDGNVGKAQFVWSFGDGSPTVTTEGPSSVTRKYGVAGTFQVTVVATDEKGATGSRTKSVTVTPNRPPSVDFDWAPEDPTWEQIVVFTALDAVDPDGDQIARYRWEFGDRSDPVEGQGSPQTASRRFGDGGTFTVSLEVWDEWDLSQVVSKEIVVELRPNEPPVVDFGWSPTNPGAGQSVAFTPDVSDPDDPPDTPFTYLWTFHDNTTSALQTPSRSYASAGSYLVRLEVTDRRGAAATKERQVQVGAPPAPPPPTVTQLSGSPATPEAGTEVTFSAVATAPTDDPVRNWEWDFGDGTAIRTTTTGTTQHPFAASGVFTVRVRAQNERGGWGSWRTLDVYVRVKGGALIGTKLLDNPARTTARIDIFLPPGASGVKVQLFDLVGRMVLSADVERVPFEWDLRDGSRRPLADGLYFYLITATVDGKTERSEVGRILVLR